MVNNSKQIWTREETKEGSQANGDKRDERVIIKTNGSVHRTRWLKIANHQGEANEVANQNKRLIGMHNPFKK